MADEPYKFRLPIRLRRTSAGCYKITDGKDYDICFVYGDEHPNPGRAKLPADEAEDIAKAIAKMIRTMGFPKYQCSAGSACGRRRRRS